MSAPSVSDLRDDNFILPFQVGTTSVRGRIVRLGSVADRILSAHGFDTALSELVGETLALVAAMGSSLKFDGRLILQAQGDGPVSMLVANYAADGGLRATASVRAQVPDMARGLKFLVGKGHMALTIDQGPDMERYQGVTPLEGDTLEHAAVAYFLQSEQIPTAIRLSVGRVSRPGEGDVWRAGAIMAQFMPGEGGSRERGEEVLQSDSDREAWARAEAFLHSTQADELIDPSLSAEALLYRLFHEDGVTVFDTRPLRADCQCSAEKVEAVLSRYEPAALADMIEDGYIRVACEFCRTAYLFNEEGRAVLA